MKYRILQSSTPITEKQLTELKKEGWRFITAIKHLDIYYWYFYDPNRPDDKMQN